MPTASPAQRVAVGKEEQRNERALTFEKSRSKRYAACSDVAAGEGFEPSQTESESVVLPLHNPAIRPRSRRDECYYSKSSENVKRYFQTFSGKSGQPSETVKRKRVVCSYFSPAFRVAEGKLGRLGLSGKCWVSRQKPWRKP